MSEKYKITYEPKDGNENRSEEVMLESEGEPSQSEVHQAVLEDMAKRQRPGIGVDGVATYTLISVTPES
ncbi:hypothetical protein O3W44_17720 [Pantoea sp. LMR881]|uniref:hypothetical protein n=1 Tax=Pantoea sp. LMR881 TaxID=3014336 RepID=UPI0022AFD0C9|nr:hypothetical protein [Pantoea sp. LMR881]MCZ4060544.1 hypothetical protein [Pantoea sp. LMR881]